MNVFHENIESELDAMTESEILDLIQRCRSALQARRAQPEVREREDEIAREFWQANGLEEGRAVPWQRPKHSFDKFPTHAHVKHRGRYWINEGDGPTHVEPGSDEDRDGAWRESYAHLKTPDGEEPQGPLFDPKKKWEEGTVVYWEGHNYLIATEPKPGSKALPGEDEEAFVRMFPDDAV